VPLHAAKHEAAHSCAGERAAWPSGVETNIMYQRILVPVDGSATADDGLATAIRLAAALKCRLTVIHVLTDFPLMVEVASVQNYDEMLARLRRNGDSMLSKAAASAAAAGVEAETRIIEAKTQEVSDVIVEEARKSQSDLIVMGTHGRRGIRRVAMGSEAELVLRSSPVPVLLVRHPEKAKLESA
jgi:nucleotide-binding universal stress UspA family protein